MPQVNLAAAEMARIPEWECIEDVAPTSKTRRVYISGPMSGYVGHNFRSFAHAKQTLEHLGYSIENPADHGYVEGWTWWDYILRDLMYLRHCDGIVVLPGFRASPGACIEVLCAQRMGMSVHRLDGDAYRGVVRADGRLDYGPDDMDIVLAHGEG